MRKLSALPVALLGAFSLAPPLLLQAQMSHPMQAPAIGSVSMPSKGSDTDPIYQSPGTKRMAERLHAAFASTDWKTDTNKAALRVSYYQELLKSRSLNLEDSTVIREQLAREMLYCGDNEGAIAQLEIVRADWKSSSASMTAPQIHELGALMALAWLRLGEQENCLEMHGQNSCLFPLRANARHQMPRGAEGAVRELTALLDVDPDDAQSQWLLNVAYMQLGSYPKDVPARWLIPESQFASDAKFPEFPEIAASEGLDVTGHAGGVLVEDFDGDGWLDVMVSSCGPNDQLRLFHNNGDGTFRDVTRRAGLIGETGGLNLVLTDYNNDGRPDVLVLRGGWWGKAGNYPLSLLRNNGDGTFDDVTEEAGLLVSGPTQTAAWADFDGDGWLDLFIGYESKPSDPHRSLLFHNNGDGTFTEIGEASGIGDLGFVKGVAWGDYNRDGRPDLYVSVMNGRNRLFRNDGPKDPHDIRKGWRFTDVSATAGVDRQHDSFATWFFDYDNDGWPDIFVAGYFTPGNADVGSFELGRRTNAELPRLYRNMHDGTFRDVTEEVHLNRAILTMGASFGDLDNDGWLDVYLGTGDSTLTALLPNRMFRNNNGRTFQDVTTDGNFGNLQKGHAVSFADLHRTGFEDVFEEMGGALPSDIFQSALYKNPGNSNHWITLKLEGVRSNRLAFGAVIDVTVRDSHGKRRQIFRTVGFGSSFGGNPIEQHIGLGSATIVDDVSVIWPATGVVDRMRNVNVDTRYILREGTGRLVIWHIPSH